MIFKSFSKIILLLVLVLVVVVKEYKILGID